MGPLVPPLLLLRRSSCPCMAAAAATAAAASAATPAAAAAATAAAAGAFRRLFSSSAVGGFAAEAAAAAGAATAAAATAAAAAEGPSVVAAARLSHRRGPPPPTGGSFLNGHKPWLHQTQQQQQQQQQPLQPLQPLQQQQQQQQESRYGAFMPADDPWYSAGAFPCEPSPAQQQQQQQQQPRQQQQQQRQHWRPSAQSAGAAKGERDTGGAGAGLQPIDWSRRSLPPIHAVRAAAAAPAAPAAAGAKATTAAAAAAADAAAAAARLQELGIKVEGAAPLPNLVTSFESAGLDRRLLHALLSLSLVSPSPVQQIGWPCCFSGRDLIAISQTGSGKTLGFLIPALMHLFKQQQQQQQHASSSGSSSSRGDSAAPSPTVLVLGPTRELVVQIHTESQRVLRAAAAAAAADPAAAAAAADPAAAAAGAAAAARPLARSVAVYGGASRPQQMMQLRRGADIVVATPGRLLDLLDCQAVRLEAVSYVVLDEADRMMDMGFAPQVRRILSQIRPDRQILLWSATWPREVEELSRDFCKKGVIRIQIGASELQANPNIQQVVEVLPSSQLQARCAAVLRGAGDSEKALVFCATKRETEQLSRELRMEGLKALAIHGDKSQRERDRIISDFTRGNCRVLVATDVASRGLDIRDIRLVLNYSLPSNIETYIHRIGRTGRAEDKGTAVTLFPNDFHSPEKLVVLLPLQLLRAFAVHPAAAAAAAWRKWRQLYVESSLVWGSSLPSPSCSLHAAAAAAAAADAAAGEEAADLTTFGERQGHPNSKCSSSEAAAANAAEERQQQVQLQQQAQQQVQQQ
ncbi:hypothetical protein Efla_000764 [Eimeria flavescens]